jgi:DNA mismatch endonuclease (patch repair protein)
MVSAQMSRMPRASTKPEVALRKRLHAQGLRFRLHRRDLPGTPDIAFARQKVAVFVDGCFWHACPDHGVIPKNNREWWMAKLAKNLSRDTDAGGCQDRPDKESMERLEAKGDAQKIAGSEW